MKITIARTSGFCMGVRRAVEMALDASNKNQAPIYTYGPLIHNPQVLSILAEKGITVLEKIPESGEGIVIIRAHGVPPRERQALIDAGFQVIDATCPRVIKVQSIIAKHARDGYASIIIGDREHPEVKGLLGYAGDYGYTADSIEAIGRLPVFEKAIIVAQTTQNTTLFEQIRAWVSQHHPHYKVFPTICDSTENRQAEVQSLASSVDAIVVVGGKSSGNTRRLYEIAALTGNPTQHIETEDELDIPQLENCRHIGITAGASTPNWIIKRVYQALENQLIRKNRSFGKWAYIIQRYLLLSNIYLALGAGSLAYAATELLGVGVRLSDFLIAALYILCMHTFNNLIDISSDRYSDPDRAMFYQDNKRWLSALTFVAGAGVLFLAYLQGPGFFILLFFMGVLGVVYNISLVPQGIGSRRKSRIRDIPGSKTILVALAWGIVTTLLPVLSQHGGINAAAWGVFLWTVCLVFVQTAFFDIMDMQGSRIVGKETIPILLGEDRTMRLLKLLAGSMAALVWAASVLGFVALSGLFIGVCPLLMWIFLYIHEHGEFSPGFRQNFLMESHFILVGVLAGMGSLILT
ncbi:MAG: 4-hydroxy-3-methylbut-2-enyl diphosphate reductase [Desulfobacterales bacterium]|nr:4-hydroxy-3-methylbut-2-enyl diphosphate reductase [Desulfobacterales bacterium]